MIKMTSAYANKLLRKLNEDKDFLRSKENSGCTYVAAIDEEPVIPEYDYAEVSRELMEIDSKILKIKHALNLSNAVNEVEVGGKMMTVDTILVSMAQLNNRKNILDCLRKRESKRRVSSGMLSSARKTAPEYEYINYDKEVVKKDYEEVDARISAMQLALDKYNQTVEFDVDI